MGGGKTKKTKTETNPYKGLPDWALDYYKADVGRGEDLISEAGDLSDWLAQNPERVANMSGQELAALQGIVGQSNKSQNLLGQAQRAIGGDRYESEYTDDVVDTTLAGMRREMGRETAARGASEAAVGGLGGTRAAVADALAQQLGGMNMAQTEAQLRSDAERFAAEMGLQESGQLESLAQSGMGLEETEARFRGTFGEQQRGIQNQRLNAGRKAKQDATSWYTDVFNSTRGLPTTGGGTTTQRAPGPSPLNQALGTAATVAGIWASVGSDERIKEDIEDAGSALDKLRKVGSYEYNYREGYDEYGRPDERTTGLMAQDLERSGIKGAVSTRDDGVKVVNPYPVLATITRAVRELDDRTRPGRGLEEVA